MSERTLGEGGADEAAAGAVEPLAVTVEALAATLGVAVAGNGGQPATLRFQQAVRLGEGLVRRSVLDLAARRFRATLWAGNHRCVDHVDLDDVCAVACDAEAGRLIVDSATARLVLNRHGALTLVPRADGEARLRQRLAPTCPVE
jgi:hypothetical protein